ncbi:MFS transporter [Nocardia inohanensis]|uniref:MFS transporter n=1 Tax=Nocardia inohanensis TaxID=209246 RepID=UPI00082CC312|nr:MFS transporter [Nocardia inohanensis]
MGAITAPPTRETVGFAALAAVQVMTIAAITMLTVALPELQRQWGSSSTVLVVISTAYSVTFGALLLVAGRLGDRIGHRRLLLIGLLVFAAASAMAAAATGPVMLVTARFTQGAGAACAVPAAMALIPAVFGDPARRTRATAIWGVLAVTGASVGTVASGFVIELVSWRWLFAFIALAALLSVAVIGRHVPSHAAAPETTTAQADAARRTGAALRDDPAEMPRLGALVGRFAPVLWVAGLILLIGGFAAASVPIAGVGAAALVGFALTQRGAAAPLWPRSSTVTAAGLLAILLAAGANAALYYVLTLHLAATGSGPAAISSLFLVPAGAVLAAGPLAARVLARLAPPFALSAGLLSAAIGLLILAAADGIPAGRIPGLLIFAIGIGVTLSAAMVIVMSAAGDTDRGLLGGLANTAMEIGPPSVLALIAPLAEGFGYRTGILILAAAPATAAATLFAIRRR